MRNKTVRVTDLRDSYFGRRVTNLGEEIAKVFSYYAPKYDWTKFSYRHWSGYEEDVKVRICGVYLDKHNDCYVEMESTADILDHYWPSPCQLIGDKYLSSYDSNSIPEEFTKVVYDG